MTIRSENPLCFLGGFSLSSRICWRNPVVGAIARYYSYPLDTIQQDSFYQQKSIFEIVVTNYWSMSSRHCPLDS